MNRYLSLLFLACSLSASAVELEGVRAPAANVCPTPEEARKKMTVPDGYEVRCFAHEPMIVNPVLFWCRSKVPTGAGFAATRSTS